MEKELLFKKKRVDRELVVAGNFHADLKIGGGWRIRNKFRKQRISAIRSIGKGKSFEYYFSSIVHHRSNMIIFTNVNANKKTKNIRTPQKKDFRLGAHSTNKRHYLVLNTERSHEATNIQLIRGKLIRERDQSFKYEQNRSRRKRSSYQSNKTIIYYQTGDVKK